jgi:hypothetical protein
MKDIKGFIKLFDLNIPNIEHLDYYIKQLSKTMRYKNIYSFIEMYKDAEQIIPDLYEFRKNKSNEIIDFITSTNTYNEMCYDKNLIDYPVNKSIQYSEDFNYLSIDIKSANWIALKKYDPPHINELGNDYSEFLKKFDIPDVFIKSKYLRQYIFGNTNPKKSIKVQRNIIQEDIIRPYQDFLDIEGVRNDEVIFKFNDFSEIQDICNNINSERFNVKIFKIKRVEDFRIDTIFDKNGNVLSNELSGVHGDLFYLKLKQYITKENIDIRDLYFRSNGRLAIWSVDNLKCEI